MAITHPTSPPPTTTKKNTLGGMARREEISFYLFIAPWIIGFLLFDAGAIISSLFISFTNWSALSAPAYVGLANYDKLFADDLQGDEQVTLLRHRQRRIRHHRVVFVGASAQSKRLGHLAVSHHLLLTVGGQRYCRGHFVDYDPAPRLRARQFIPGIFWH